MRKAVLVETLDEKERQTVIDFEDLIVGLVNECVPNDFVSITMGADNIVYNIDDIYMVKDFIRNMLNNPNITFNKRKIIAADITSAEADDD